MTIDEALQLVPKENDISGLVLSYAKAIRALKVISSEYNREKAEREKMRCENCKYFKKVIDNVGDCEREDVLYLNISTCGYCSFFESREETRCKN